jgi:cysteine desulfurase
MPEPSVYLDHAATTPVRPEVLEAMLPYLGSDRFGNPSSAHRPGRAAQSGLEQARREVAEAVGAEPSSVVFTSGGTEADNLAILGSAFAAHSAGRRMLAAVAATEHKAVLAAAHAVVHHGGEERILPVDGHGCLDLGALDHVLVEHPAIVSVMWANNETGVLQPIPDIAQRCEERGTLFHTDLVQAFGRVPVSLRAAPVALATLSGHKLGAPKGIGALIVRKGTPLEPILHGGSQQGALRPGTENVAGAVALGRAAQLAAQERAAEAVRLGALRDDLAKALRDVVPDLVIPGESAPRVPHILNLLVPGAESGALLMHLDLAGIAASGGSACQTGAPDPSHVLLAMGVPRDRAAGAVRFSLGRSTRAEDIARVAEVWSALVARVRRVGEALGRA